MTMNAIGMYAFAGGFTRGVQEVFNVRNHVEVGPALGIRTAQEMCKITLHPYSAPLADCQLVYGMPCDSLELQWMVHYGVANKVPFIVAAGAQQFDLIPPAALLEVQDRYRICEVLVSARTFSNPQNVDYIFRVFYSKDFFFNIELPPLAKYATMVRDVIGKFQNSNSHEKSFEVVDVGSALAQSGYDGNATFKLSPEESACIPFLDFGWDLNTLAEYRKDKLPEKLRMLNMKFEGSLRRLAYDAHCPPLTTQSKKWIHPVKNRLLTISELSALAGWPDDSIPRGFQPYAQLGVNILPKAGAWIAHQVKLSLDNEWGNEDYYWTYRADTQFFDGGAVQCPETLKTFDLRQYVPTAWSGEKDWRKS